ncbi:MAG: hypothetical protein KA190_31710, partial [Kofleriaceae bacterium]|nr:hypothetical protein [Kofleriaceae bacterium]
MGTPVMSIGQTDRRPEPASAPQAAVIARDAPRLARRVATLDRERAWAWRPGHSIRQGDAALARLQVSTYSLMVSTPRRPTKERQLELVDAALRL